ncbi:ComF family protein [Limnobaculum xujianqingii]|uniref:ComF family protein n=1 Tax=Limnobaculum xujianqingii TaxID=2738837 RepID=UPI0015B9F933|nr:phosphoribosyltransferase family protein [Limnobaculum xujianqingii]
MHDEHALSQDIYEKEIDPDFIAPKYWVDLLSHAIKSLYQYYFNNNTGFDIVSVIPAKKNKNPRLENLLERISKNFIGGVNFIPDLFIFSENARSLKTLNQQQRYVEITNTLFLNDKYRNLVRGKRVLIIDDVITTGATFERAFSILNENQSYIVLGLCLAKTVSINETSKICDSCGRTMRILKNSDTEIRFWGCTGFNDTNTPCSHTESIVVKDCPLCGRSMYKHYNRQHNSYFLSCEGWNKNPKCTYSESL